MKKMIIIGALTLFISLCAMAQETTVPAETTGGVMIDVTTFAGMMALVTMFVTELCKVVAYIDQHKWAKVLCSVGVGIAATMACWSLQVSDFLAGLVWWQALVAGVAVGLSAAGFYDVIKALWSIFKPKTEEKA